MFRSGVPKLFLMCWGAMVSLQEMIWAKVKTSIIVQILRINFLQLPFAWTWHHLLFSKKKS